MSGDGLQSGKTRWTHYSIAYHLVWIPKYRRPVLTDDVGKRTRELLAEVCEFHGLTLLEANTDEDHVHAFVSAPPRYSPSEIASLLKGYTSKHLREEFPRLRKICGRDKLWTQTYYVGTAGNVSAATIRRYIAESQGK